jgi:hypothetical protein
MTDIADPQPRRFQIVRNGDPTAVYVDWSTGLANVQKGIADALNARNIAFLLGAGCSSLRVDEQEVGIATMQPLATTFCDATVQALMLDQMLADLAACHPETSGTESDELSTPDSPQPSWLFSKDEVDLLEGYGITLEAEYAKNLERLMEVLHSLSFILRRSQKSSDWPGIDLVAAMIAKVQAFLLERCTAPFSQADKSVVDLYERFYRKLVFRDRSLPRPWVFTTNYDLFNETAMDRLAIPYANGFSGVVERRFNPSTFRYALAEQLDVTSRRWSAVDAFVYLCKLHGSISWTEDDHGLFPIREKWPSDSGAKMMIFPTPTKQNSSLGSPYADLFREFQSRVVQEQSVLITAGYAFGDEHINNIIYQALTIPTFRLIIFAAVDTGGDIAKLRALGDPRIWIIGGDGPVAGSRAHYFNTIIEHFMPQRPSERIDDAVRKVLEVMTPVKDDPL